MAKVTITLTEADVLNLVKQHYRAKSACVFVLDQTDPFDRRVGYSIRVEVYKDEFSSEFGPLREQTP